METQILVKKIHFRQQAKRHRDVARAYLELGDDDLMYASALRLRMAIECLAYELLQALGDEVSQNVMETWQPNKLIKELKHIDASVDQDVSIRIGIEKTPGQPAEEMKDLGTDVRFSATWISKQWNGCCHVKSRIRQVVVRMVYQATFAADFHISKVSSRW